jgi:hypothetical protein
MIEHPSSAERIGASGERRKYTFKPGGKYGRMIGLVTFFYVTLHATPISSSINHRR